MWVHKKAFSKPRKMKQVWVIKGTLAQSEVLINNEVRKINQNQKSYKEKRRLQNSDQRSHQVSFLTPKFKWVPKIS